MKCEYKGCPLKAIAMIRILKLDKYEDHYVCLRHLKRIVDDLERLKE